MGRFLVEICLVFGKSLPNVKFFDQTEPLNEVSVLETPRPVLTLVFNSTLIKC